MNLVDHNRRSILDDKIIRRTRSATKRPHFPRLRKVIIQRWVDQLERRTIAIRLIREDILRIIGTAIVIGDLISNRTRIGHDGDRLTTTAQGATGPLKRSNTGIQLLEHSQVLGHDEVITRSDRRAIWNRERKATERPARNLDISTFGVEQLQEIRAIVRRVVVDLVDHNRRWGRHISADRVVCFAGRSAVRS